jgi:hypothetical protein
VLLWNVWEQVEAARNLIAASGPFTRENLRDAYWPNLFRRNTMLSNKRSSLHLIEDKNMQDTLDADLRGIYHVAAWSELNQLEQVKRFTTAYRLVRKG